MRPVAATRGLTLIEVLVAVVVITVVALGLVGIQLLSLRITRSSQESSLATQLAVETLTDAFNRPDCAADVRLEPGAVRTFAFGVEVLE